MKIFVLVLFVFIGLVGANTLKNDFGSENDWDEYLGGSDRNHYSKLSQINTENVAKLKVAWTYSLPDSGQMQVNPLVINGVLYGVSSSVQAFALNAATGEKIWQFGDPLRNWASTSRGVSYWANGKEKRILYTAGPNLWALSAENGKPIESFGNNGKIDLHEGLPEIAKNKFIISNTPGTIYENLIIMPTRVSEDIDAAPGDIRAFDVISGKLVWTFHTIPHPGEFGYETFPPDAYKNSEVGAVNNWAGMAVDKKLGILFVPLGSASYDFYGSNRHGSNLFANCLVALNAKTGKRIWHFQTTHHDLWDKDLPAPPNLVNITKNGKEIEAAAQITKQGLVFLFDRKTGKPIYEIKETPVPQSTLAGEKSWPTQPIPTLPKPFARQSYEISTKSISPYAENKEELMARLKNYKTALYAPPSLEGTVILPGFDGGAEWGGAAVDPKGIMYVNSNEMAWIQTMKETKEIKAGVPLGEATYQKYCITCHGFDREGDPESGSPSIARVSSKYDKGFVSNLITTGKGMMPGFSMLTAEEKSALVQFLFNEEKKEVGATQNQVSNQLKYKMQGYNKFLDSKGLPALAPPWGTLNAIDLNTGQIKWKIPLGEEPTLAAKGIKNTGTENYGGPIVTAGNLLIIAATKDTKIRAFDKNNGKLLWEYQLPAAAFATPSTYMINGKQYIVVACGGAKLGTPKGNKYVAFALE